tara:strand:+ start:1998 stop:2210 length:213 start_codon:yes stop_codon:yes gene_type:complete
MIFLWTIGLSKTKGMKHKRRESDKSLVTDSKNNPTRPNIIFSLDMLYITDIKLAEKTKPTVPVIATTEAK